MKGRAFLFMEAGRRVYRCQFTKDLTLLGADKGNDIVIRDPTVEPNHAQISRAGDVYTLRALGEGELRVDGEEVEAGHELMNGNLIELGDTEVLFAREQHEAPTTVHLVIRKPGEPPMGFWTSKSTVVIGREKGDIIIDDALLSKVHCIIENFCHNGQFILDARSERGTGLNGESLESRHRIVAGDVINVGNVEIEFHCEAPDSSAGRSAADLAAERIHQLRKHSGRRVSSEVGGAADAAPLRNPYQRYASELPDVDPPPLDSRPASPDDMDAVRGRRVGGRIRASTGVNLRAGVETGIVNVNEGVSPARLRPPRGNSAPSPRASGREAPRAAVGGGKRPDREPEALPNFEPRPHWGDPDKRSGFGDRPNEMDTRLSRGNVDDSGLWYVPGVGRGGRGKAVAKPIIRPRGDVVPDAPPERVDAAPSPRSRDPQQPARARIRRPAGDGHAGSARIQPMKPRTEAPRSEAPSVPEPVARRGPAADATAAPAIPGKAVGVRPDNRDRWYIPEDRKKDIRQRRDDAAWYLPDGKAKKRPSADDYQDEYGDRHERPDRSESKGKGGGGTQVFDGDDY